jgi:hypothetical protein
MMQVLQQQVLLQLLLQLQDFCRMMRFVARFLSLQQPFALLQPQNDSRETLYCRTPPQPPHTMTPAYLPLNSPPLLQSLKYRQKESPYLKCIQLLPQKQNILCQLRRRAALLLIVCVRSCVGSESLRQLLQMLLLFNLLSFLVLFLLLLLLLLLLPLLHLQHFFNADILMQLPLPVRHILSVGLAGGNGRSVYDALHNKSPPSLPSPPPPPQ